MMRKIVGMVLAIGLVVVTASCAHSEGSPAGELKAEVVDCSTVTPAAEISMKEFLFDPNEVTINAGDTVKWINMGNSSHMITSGGPSDNPGAIFGTAFITVKREACVKFVNRGVYSYFCRPHGNLMKDGKIVVK